MSSKRKIIIKEKEWTWQLGKHECIAKCESLNRTEKIDLSTLTGWSWEAIEKSSYKGGGWCVTPKHVAEWLNQIADNTPIIKKKNLKK